MDLRITLGQHPFLLGSSTQPLCLRRCREGLLSRMRTSTSSPPPLCLPNSHVSLALNLGTSSKQRVDAKVCGQIESDRHLLSGFSLLCLIANLSLAIPLFANTLLDEEGNPNHCRRRLDLHGLQRDLILADPPRPPQDSAQDPCTLRPTTLMCQSVHPLRLRTSRVHLRHLRLTHPMAILVILVRLLVPTILTLTTPWTRILRTFMTFSRQMFPQSLRLPLLSVGSCDGNDHFVV